MAVFEFELLERETAATQLRTCDWQFRAVRDVSHKIPFLFRAPKRPGSEQGTLELRLFADFFEKKSAVRKVGRKFDDSTHRHTAFL